MIIILQGYGDFDIPYVDSLWTKETNKDEVNYVKKLIEESCDKDTSFVKAYNILKNNGFRRIKNKEIVYARIGGGL